MNPSLNTSPADLLARARAGFASGGAAGEHPAPDSAWAGRARAQIWRAGERLASAEAADAEEAVEHAAAAAAAALSAEQRNADDLYVSIELVQDLERIEPEGLSGLLQHIQPGLHGLVLRDGDRVVGGWPSDALREAEGSPQWIKGLLRALRPPGARLPASAVVQRFRALHVVGPGQAETDGADIQAAALVGGIRLVAQESVTGERLATAAVQAGAWLAGHQQQDGLFHYEYRPETGAWTREDSIVRQAGSAWALATLAAVVPQTGLQRAATAAVAGVLRSGLHRDGPGGLFYLASPDGTPRLGATPLILLAAGALRSGARVDADVITRLAGTLLAIQERNGRFGTHARGLALEGSETYYAGQCALALAREYGRTKRARYATAVRRALQHYQDRWHTEPEARDLSFVAWMLQTCEAWHAQTDDAEAAAYAFAMADWALTLQHDADHPHPLWAGAYGATPGIGTAAYTEGMLRALALARRVKDDARAARYLQSVQLSMRFLLQLTMEPSDLAFSGGAEHRGAVRASLRRRGLRCDHAQHFLMCALQAAALTVSPQDEATETAAAPLPER